MFIENIAGGVDSTKWEDMCIQAYIIKYADYNFIEVPARNQGDGGIEGFTKTGKGIAIQCYYPENDFNYSELYTHQRDKITKDIKKLLDKDNATKNLKHMGIKPIKEWHFLVPTYSNKELIKHAENKSKEVRDKIKTNGDLYDYLDKDFTICLCTEKHIAEYLTDLILINNSSLSLNIAFVDENKIDWASTNNNIKDNMYRKIKKLGKPQSEEQLMDRFMKGYVSGIDELVKISEYSNKIYVQILNLISEYTSEVEIESLMDSGGMIPFDRYKELNAKFLQRVNDELPFLTVTSKERLTRQVISKWLGDCPLDF